MREVINKKSHQHCKQINATEMIPLRVNTQSVQGNHHRTLAESCCQCHTRQNAVSAPPQSNSPAQKHEKTAD